ncbi:hypothetical protein ACGH6T_10040, partial [Gilliamella sp. BG6]
LSLCNAPYKVTLDSSEGTLETRYGMPNSSTFSGGTAEYYITLPSQPVICSVRPNLNYGTGRYAGPPSMWNPAKGFLIQSTNPSSYGLNFPTTGADGLYFDLDIVGVDASQLSWTVTTLGDITAAVSWTRPLSGTFTDPKGNTIPADEWITDKSKNVTRVTLNGPKADSTQINSDNPSSLTRPSLPQTFELVGRDRSGNEVRYGFVLRQWFVNRGGQWKTYSDQLAWCNSLGYRPPQVRNLTNGKCYSCISGSGIATSDTPLFKRHIGAGFFTEWGSMQYYADVGFMGDAYFSSELKDGKRSNVVSGNFGATGTFDLVYDRGYTICTAP